MVLQKMAQAAVSLVCFSFVIATPTILTQRTTMRQALAVDFPDPDVYYDGSMYWAFASNSSDGKVNIQIASSPDFNSWTFYPGQDALPDLTRWANWAADIPFIWAPSVMRNSANMYVMYYSAVPASDTTKHCIGVATSWNITGPYTSYPSPLICPLDQGGAIDPSAFQDADGTRYLVYKIDGNSKGRGPTDCHNLDTHVPTPIMLQKVDPTGLQLIDDPVQLLNIGPLDGPLIEAPSLVLTNGTYTLFFSSNCFDTPLYDISYAMASAIDGPYTRHGPFATTGTNGLSAPGGASVNVYNPSQMVFHAGSMGSRFLYTADIGIQPEQGYVTGM